METGLMKKQSGQAHITKNLSKTFREALAKWEFRKDTKPMAFK